MGGRVLLVSGIAGAESCAAALRGRLGVTVEVAPGRREALAVLRRQGFEVMVVEAALVEADDPFGDELWQLAGAATPLQVNFAISGCPRLIREVRAALIRRAHEGALARQAAAVAVENELRSSVTGLLLQAELTLRHPTVPAELLPQLQELVALADGLRQRLRQAASPKHAAPTG